MKAITCSQCGALIGDVSVSQKFTKCDYCSATFQLEKEKVFEISRKEAKTINANFQKPFSPTTINNKKPIAAIIIGVLFMTLLPIVIVSVVIFSRSTDLNLYFAKSKLKVDMSMTAKAVITGTSFDSFNFNMLNFDHAEFPKYSESELPDVEADELLETVFAERRINVEVKVDKKGNITEAKAINGHKYLKRICEAAALKTTFFPPVASEVTVIYLFSVKKR